MSDATLYDSAPPDEAVRLSAPVRLKRAVTARLSAAILPIVKQAARPYVGGETVEEALAVVDRLAGEGHAATIGYWDAGRDSARGVAEIYLNAMDCLSITERKCYVSLKPPPLRFSADLAGELAEAAAQLDLRLHLDSHGVEAADLSNAMLEAMTPHLDGAHLGTTLPGRWERSLADADWAIRRGINVRVVKGQWPDPADRSRDISGGYLAVIGRLAGRARHVAVATHDFALATESVRLLKAADTSCELELLLGMPAKKLVAWAKDTGVPVRVYVPYGGGFVPNALGVLKRNPHLVVAVAKDRLAAIAAFFGGLLKPRGD